MSQAVSVILAQELRMPFYVLQFNCGTGQQKGGKWVSNPVHMHTPGGGDILPQINLLICWHC